MVLVTNLVKEITWQLEHEVNKKLPLPSVRVAKGGSIDFNIGRQTLLA